MNKSSRDVLLGLVFFAGIALLLWATFNLGSVSMRKATLLEVRFPNAGGLREGDQVQVLGKRAGQVLSVRIEPSMPSHRILVALQLDDPVELKSDASLQIRDTGLLGGRGVDIDPGIAPTPRDRSAILFGKTVGGAFDSIGEFFGGDTAQTDFSGALTAIRRFFENMNDPRSSIGKLTNESVLYDRLADSAESLSNLLRGADRGEGLLGMILRDPKLANDAKRLVEDFAEVMAQVRLGKSLVGRLMMDSELGQRFADTLLDVGVIVQDLRAGKGMAGALFRDDEVGSQFKETVENITAVTRSARDPGTFVGSLFNDPKLRDWFASTLENLATVTDRIRSGDGLIARLINDREMGEMLERIFVQVSRSLEDAREAAPVATLFSVIGGIL